MSRYLGELIGVYGQVRYFALVAAVLLLLSALLRLLSAVVTDGSAGTQLIVSLVHFGCALYSIYAARRIGDRLAQLREDQR